MKYSSVFDENNDDKKSVTTPSVPWELISVFFSLMTVIFWIASALAVQALRGSIPDLELNVFRMGGRTTSMRLPRMAQWHRLL